MLKSAHYRMCFQFRWSVEGKEACSSMVGLSTPIYPGEQHGNPCRSSFSSLFACGPLLSCVAETRRWSPEAENPVLLFVLKTKGKPRGFSFFQEEFYLLCFFLSHLIFNDPKINQNKSKCWVTYLISSTDLRPERISVLTSNYNRVAEGRDSPCGLCPAWRLHRCPLSKIESGSQTGSFKPFGGLKRIRSCVDTWLYQRAGNP